MHGQVLPFPCAFICRGALVFCVRGSCRYSPPMRFRFLSLSMALALLLGVSGCSINGRKSATPGAVAHASAAEIVQPETPEQSEKRAEAHAHFLTGLSLDQSNQAE